jgi:AraC-like DNA-binding protein
MTTSPLAEPSGVETFATAELREWRRHVSQSFVPLEVETDRPGSFRAELRAKRIDRLSMFDIRVSPHAVVRTPEHVARSGRDYYKLSMQLRGRSLLLQDGKEALLSPGDIAIYDTTRPYTLVSDDQMRQIVLMFPRAAIDLSTEDLAELTATRLPADRTISQVVSPFLLRMATNFESLQGLSALRLAHTTIDLVTTLFASELDVGLASSLEPRRRLLSQIKNFIEANLDDDTLSPHQVAAAHYISVRQLHQIFQSEGRTVSTWIRRRRLEQCRRMLGDPVHAARSVSEIGARWGLPDAPHFSRVFKAEYGVSPRQFRGQALRDDA